MKERKKYPVNVQIKSRSVDKTAERTLKTKTACIPGDQQET